MRSQKLEHDGGAGARKPGNIDRAVDLCSVDRILQPSRFQPPEAQQKLRVSLHHPPQKVLEGGNLHGALFHGRLPVLRSESVVVNGF